jgi:hypothetical protein
MRIVTLLAASAVVALAAVGAPGKASAAGLTLSGTYLLQYTSNCQAIFNETPNGGGIKSVSQGHIEEEIGTITFTPANAAANSGKVALALQTVAGDSAVLEHGSAGATGVSAAPFATTGTYSYTTNGNVVTIELSPTSRASFQSVLGAGKSGVAQSAVILKQPANGDTCIESAVLMHD